MNIVKGADEISTDTEIPKVVYQTWKNDNIPVLIRYWQRRMRKVNPEFDFTLFTDQQIDDFIKQHYIDEIFAIYQRLKIGAFKSDFFRVLVLYRFGGVYIDLDDCYLKRLDHLTKLNKAIVIEPHLMVFPKFSPILKRLIMKYLDASDEKLNDKISFYLINLPETLHESPAESYERLPEEKKNLFHILGAKVVLYPEKGQSHWTVRDEEDRKKYIKSKGGNIMFWLNRHMSGLFVAICLLAGNIKVWMKGQA